MNVLMNHTIQERLDGESELEAPVRTQIHKYPNEFLIYFATINLEIHYIPTRV